MAELTTDQINFLKSHGIVPTQVFDASRIASKAAREIAMDQVDAKFYFGGAPCKKAGHTLRTKAGHCIQCDTSKIAYQLRHSGKGTVYLACSSRTGLIKVGVTNGEVLARIDVLNYQGYGNASDWELIRSKTLDKDAGRTEFSIHAMLEPYQHMVKYEKNKGNFVECRELFICDLQTVVSAFESIMTRQDEIT